MSEVDTAKNCYQTSFQHLQDELKRISLLMYRQVLKIRRERRADISPDNMGLFITDEEVDGILKDEINEADKEDSNTVRSTSEIDKLDTYIQQISLRISEKASSSLSAGIQLPIFHLMKTVHLTPFETDCLLVLMAAETDTKYEKVYAYLQNDVTKKGPSVGMILDLLCRTAKEKAEARASFIPNGILMRHRIMEFSDKTSDEPLIARPVKIDGRIVNFLLGIEDIDPRLKRSTNIIEPQLGLNDLIIPIELKERVRCLSNYINNYTEEYPLTARQSQSIIYFKGIADNGQSQVTGALCHAAGLELLEVDIAAMVDTLTDLSLGLQLLFRETLLRPSAVYIKGLDVLLNEESGRNRAAFLDAITEYKGLLFLEGEKDAEALLRKSLSNFFVLDFPVPPYSIRKDLWEHHLDTYRIRDDLDTASLANKFRLTGGQIKNSIETAISIASTRNDGPVSVSYQDILEGCRAMSNQKLASLAQKIQHRYNWGDIVLPVDVLARLKEICSYVKYRNIVYDDWGFYNKLSLGKGLNALFHGTSGTGKTMAAEIIARELGLDLYKIDLSLVVSKYIGETEKNLGRIFREGAAANAIIFFDEADALFGKRSEVHDAHDRYANIEVAFLLQKIEEYEGIVLLATNLPKNVDEAFTRRMQFSVEFPFPDEESRLRIWESIFPPTTPIADDIDYKFLAKRFQITGGNIKNIVLTAAFLAAEGPGVINMKCIMQATRRELQKMGMVSIPSDFGKYYELTLGHEK